MYAIRSYYENASDDLACYALVVRVPPVDPFPIEFRGKTAIAIVACHSGSLENGKSELIPLQDFGNPILRVIVPMPFLALQTNFDPGVPNGMRYYWKAHYMDKLSDDAIDIFVDYTKEP